MICGTSGSGKSTLTTAILERLSDAGYQVLVVDPEGDYTERRLRHAHRELPMHPPHLEERDRMRSKTPSVRSS